MFSSQTLLIILYNCLFFFFCCWQQFITLELQTEGMDVIQIF